LSGGCGGYGDMGIARLELEMFLGDALEDELLSYIAILEKAKSSEEDDEGGVGRDWDEVGCASVVAIVGRFGDKADGADVRVSFTRDPSQSLFRCIRGW